MSENYWFPHDFNAKDDPKMMLLIDELGMEGVGIYWVLIETLRSCPETKYRYPLKLVPSLARKYATTTPKMQTVITSYQLFEIENKEFFLSRSLCRRMEKYDLKCEQMRINALIGVQKRKNEMMQEEQKLSQTLSCIDSNKQKQNQSLAVALPKENSTEEYIKKENKKESLSMKNLLDFSTYKKRMIEKCENDKAIIRGACGYKELIIERGFLHNLINGKDLHPDEAKQVWKAMYDQYRKEFYQA